ncbi:MAG: PQQ-dependent sugar dehydrogenase [Phycisphaerales bacterium]|nr:PQQ-dependent sugar dehydrogenase [Phycisphaerales bacterium]
MRSSILASSLTIGAALSLALSSAVPAHAQTVDQLWNTNCASCHAQGGGKDAVASLLDDEWKAGGTPRQVFDAIKSGHAGFGPENFNTELTDPQIWGVTNYLFELRAINYRNKGGKPKEENGIHTSQHAKYRVEDVVSSGLSIPWSVEFVPDLGNDPLSKAMLITERAGTFRVYTGVAGEAGKGKLSAPVEGIPEVFHGDNQAGLLDIALHPDFVKNRWIYLSYSDGAMRDGRQVAMTKVIRGKLVPKQGGGWSWTDERTIFQARPEHYTSPGVHYGCRFAFDPKDPTILFFAIGERGRQDMAQDLGRPHGKVHRVKDDGAIPNDNPFAANTGNVYKSIWSYGHRNPQGLVFGLDGNLYDTEHGPRGGDELNLVRKGRNYGWPVVTFGVNYDGRPWNVPWPEFAGKTQASLASDDEMVSPDAIAMPVYVWLPSIAACGLTTCSGGVFPDWKGDLFAGGLAAETVQRLRIKDGKVTEREELLYQAGRVRDVVCGPDGAIYVALNGPDKVVRLVPAK